MCIRGEEEEVREALGRGGDPNTKVACPGEGESGTPLMAAARGGHEEVVALLLAHPGLPSGQELRAGIGRRNR